MHSFLHQSFISFMFHLFITICPAICRTSVPVSKVPVPLSTFQSSKVPCKFHASKFQFPSRSYPNKAAHSVIQSDVPLQNSSEPGSIKTPTPHMNKRKEREARRCMLWCGVWCLFNKRKIRPPSTMRPLVVGGR